ncbi:MAG: hypothetical protein NTY68_03260 [Candidatus Micrarchaeota archaeon]|nr:hypothetical protein [Candidatus Micrarchaeota archaeon]
MDENAVLEGLGLSPGESKVYLALLSLETAGVGPIAHRSGVSRSKIYEIIEKLAAKGLVNQIITTKQRMFRASGPNALLELVDKRKEKIMHEEEEVKRLIPELLALHAPKEKIVEFFEGFFALKAIREELLGSMKKGEDMLVLGAPRAANEKWEQWFLQFHETRQKMGVGARILYNADTREYGQIRTGFKYTQVKYMPQNFITPTWFDVFGENVLIVILPKGEKPYALLVRDRSVAESVRAYFEMLWTISLD